LTFVVTALEIFWNRKDKLQFFHHGISKWEEFNCVSENPYMPNPIHHGDNKVGN